MAAQADILMVSEETLLAIEEGRSAIRKGTIRELNEFCDSHGIWRVHGPSFPQGP